jgi:hypothetical protein
MDSESRARRRRIAEPRRGWVDKIVASTRDHEAVLGVVWLYERAVPLLFAVFVAAPVGLVILPFFIPKFIRSARRRRRYRVRPSTLPVERISGFTGPTNL